MGTKTPRTRTAPSGRPRTRYRDFERGFIKAEMISFTDYDALETEVAARAAGRLRIEGREYVVADGDVMHFRLNV